MPSITIELPPNVERRKRSDGSHRYIFRPRRNRPPNWPKLLRFFPRTSGGIEINELEDPAAFAAALDAWAKKLNADLAKAKTPADSAPARGSLPWVWEQYRQNDRFTAKKKPTQDGYVKLARYIRDWSQRMNHPHVSRYTYEGIERFVNGWKNAPHQRRAVQRFLSLLFKHAMRRGLRDDNPAAAMSLSVPKSHIHIWEDAETDFMVAMADAIGKASMGTAILICHEIGPREDDVIAMQAPDHYRDGTFRFTTSKTASKLAIPATIRLRTRLEKDGVPLHRHLILTEAKKVPYGADHFRHIFARVRDAAGAVMAVQALADLFSNDERRFIDVTQLLYRQLRHTAVVQLARAGCTVPEIAAITGHSIKTVTQILEHYLPRDSVVAGNAIAKLEAWRKK